MQKSKLNTILLVIVIILLAVVFVYISRNDLRKKENVENQNIMCSQDAKQCPDGSYVGRTGPNCEFLCPEVKITENPKTIPHINFIVDQIYPIYFTNIPLQDDGKYLGNGELGGNKNIPLFNVVGENCNGCKIGLLINQKTFRVQLKDDISYNKVKLLNEKYGIIDTTSNLSLSVGHDFKIPDNANYTIYDVAKLYFTTGYFSSIYINQVSNRPGL